MDYTFDEYADMMLLIYGEVHCIGRAASRLYQERFPERRVPAHMLFERVNQRIRETGFVRITRPDNGAQRTVRTPEFEEEVLRQFEENPGISTRAVAEHIVLIPALVERLLVLDLAGFQFHTVNGYVIPDHRHTYVGFPDQNDKTTEDCRKGELKGQEYFSPSNLLTQYKVQIKPSLDYCSHIWGAAAPTTLSILDAVQRRAIIRLIGDPALT
nr:unnamed protein product [Callosobruchus chinensis]